MKKGKSNLQVAADFLKSTGPALLKLQGTQEGTEDTIFLLGNGDMIWLAVSDGPEYPVLNIDDLLVSGETATLILDLFCAAGTSDTDLDSVKLYAFEDNLRKVLHTYNLPAEKVREIKISFMDAKEELLKEED